MSRRDESRAALAQILELAQTALGDEPRDHQGNGQGTQPVITCTPKALPARLQKTAADLARRVNPANAPLIGASAGLFGGAPLDPMQISVLTSKFWGPTPRRLTVSFMDAPSVALRNRILSHMNAWSARIGISFAFTQGVGQVRISLVPDGHWSYLGTDVLLIPTNRATMNLQGFSLNTSEAEYKRVVRHETGHTLGCPHEHMRKAIVDRIDRDKAYTYFWQTQRWDEATVDQQVLTPLGEASIMGTPADQTSIMSYQLPGSIMKNGQAVSGGADINATDYAFMATLYPRPGASAQRYTPEHGARREGAFDEATTGGALEAHGPVEDWDPAEDVRLEDLEILA
jgi:hypothetical protein